MPWLNHASGNEHEIQLSGPGQDLWIVTALVEVQPSAENVESKNNYRAPLPAHGFTSP